MADRDQVGLAREHATHRVPTAGAKQTVDEVRSSLAGQSFESASDVAVLDGDELAGLLSIERLLAVDGDALVEEVMDADPPTAAPDTDREAVAWKMINRGESSVPIVDSTGDFIGLVPPNRMLNVLMTEHDEDVARLGGYLASTDRARQAAEERVTRRLWHRLPWLLVGLVGAIASAGIIGAFEQELDSNVLLAFFIPGVVYMAAAIGTQTQTVLIRGFAVGVSLRHVLRRELISGLLLSLAISAAFLPVAAAGWGDTDVALGVTLALFASSIAATLVAIALPWGFQRAGADPAFGSGPLATVIQDLVTIGIYFAVALPIAA
jgi:magnesium transporter